MRLHCGRCRASTEVADDLLVSTGPNSTVWVPVAVWWDSVGHLCSVCRAKERELAARTPPVLDRASGERLRADGMARADDHANADWKLAARLALRSLAFRQEYVTADDLWASGLPKPAEPRAAGPIFMWGKKKLLIENSGQMMLTAQASGHRHPQAVWRSLVWPGARP